MSAQTLLSGGDKWYSYSGEVFGDVSAPATISMILIPNTGLRDSLMQIQPFYGAEIATGSGSQLGIIVKLDDVTVIRQQQMGGTLNYDRNEQTNLFVPRQSKIEIIRLNTSSNNTQISGVNVIGYYI